MNEWQQLTDSERIVALLHMIADLSQVTNELVDRVIELEDWESTSRWAALDRIMAETTDSVVIY